MTTSYRELHRGQQSALICFPGPAPGSCPFAHGQPLRLKRFSLWVAWTAGREDRLREPAPTEWTDPVDELTNDLPVASPFVFFGHCLGALIAFEVTRELQRRNRPMPERLLVVGTAPAVRAHQTAPTDVYEAGPRNRNHPRGRTK